MRRCTRLTAARLVRLGLASLGTALLPGLVIVALALAGSGQPDPGLFSPAALAAAPTSRPTAHTTATAHATPGKGKGSQSGGGSQSTTLPSWLPEGVVALLVVLLGFGLVIVPLALRSEQRNQPIYKPGARRSADEQIARLSLIPPERKEPLSREQMQALRASQQQHAEVSRQFTGSLEAAHLVSGVPVSPPGSEAEATPQLLAPHQPDQQDGAGDARETGNNG